MNKSISTAIGAVLVTTAILRSTAPVSTPSPNEHPGAHSAVTEEGGKKSTGEGPWIASCQYWAPARPAVGTETQEQQVISIPSEEGGAECGDDTKKRWGLPASANKPDIKSLIALVPDPVHTNMTLQFDRTIDALMAAAGEYEYLSSYYWLPWEDQSPSVTPLDEGGIESRAFTLKSAHEPGLIILKYVGSRGQDESTSSSADDFTHVVYLFLVGETPTTGIDGFQMQKAFQYQDELASAGASLTRSTGKDASSLAIIGPTYSGSAASLRKAIDTMLGSHREITSVAVSGATATRIAVKQLNADRAPSAATALNAESGRTIEYRSFSYDGTFDQERLLSLLSDSSSRSNPTRVAFLIEDGTAFGLDQKGATGLDKNGVTTKKHNLANQLSPLVIGFPREISLLRNAQAQQGGAEKADSSGAAPSPYLHLSLKDSNAYDSVPHLSRENTPLSQEAQLMTIARQLLRYRSQYIVISASNVLDQLFLAQFLHRACPDARLVFYVGDLLFERDIDNVPFIGTITVIRIP